MNCLDQRSKSRIAQALAYEILHRVGTGRTVIIPGQSRSQSPQASGLLPNDEIRGAPNLVWGVDVSRSSAFGRPPRP